MGGAGSDGRGCGGGAWCVYSTGGGLHVVATVAVYWPAARALTMAGSVVCFEPMLLLLAVVLSDLPHPRQISLPVRS